MNLLFLSHMFPNNIAPFSVPFMLERAKALARYVSLEVVAPVSFFPFVRNHLPKPRESIGSITVHHPRYLALPSVLWSVRWYPYFLSFRSFWGRRNVGSDILHIEWIYPDAFAVAKFAKKRGIRTIGVVHGNEAIEYFGPVKRRKIYSEAFVRLDHIIVVSDDLEFKLINEYSVEPQKISVILNGVDITKFPLIDKLRARRELEITENRSVGVCVARLSQEKNLHVLIKAAAYLKDVGLTIYIVGDGPLKNNLQALISKLGLTNHVKLVGPVPHDEIALWLNAADYFYLPSQREGCPVVVHEALACGVPVIATSVGAIPDLIKDSRYGLLCEPDNTAAFAGIMKKAMSMSWDRNAISSYGRQFTWDKMARETVATYNSLLKNSNEHNVPSNNS